MEDKDIIWIAIVVIAVSFIMNSSNNSNEDYQQQRYLDSVQEQRNWR